MHDRVMIYNGEPTPLFKRTSEQEIQERKWISFGGYTIYRPDLGKLAKLQDEMDQVGEWRTSQEKF